MNDLELYYPIPRGVKRFVLKRRLKRIIPFLLLAVSLILVVAYVPFVKELSELNRGIILVVGVILICAITGVPFKLIDRSWEGEVIKIQVKARRDEGMGEYPYSGRAVIDARLFTEKKVNAVLYLTLKTPNGKIDTVRVGALSNDEERDRDGGYKTGDRVLHVGGTDYTVVLNCDERVRCCVCGMTSDIHNDVCPGCGHSLIKPFKCEKKAKLN